jgi:predicted ATPase
MEFFLDIQDKNGYTLLNLNKINIVLGKNGSGKSTILKKVQEALELDDQYGHTKYITPERGGTLEYSPSMESNVRSTGWLSTSLRRNQFKDFKQQTVLQYRQLERLILREIANIPEIRNNHNYTFQSVIDKINTLLDNIEIKSADSDFKIYKKDDGAEINPADISSGEAELIALGIECLVFAKECQEGAENILFLDEPDAHLHPDLQVRLALFLKNVIEQNEFRVVLATHSTSFLAAFEGYDDISIGFIVSQQNELEFTEVSETYRRILPIFGAHPLSNLFNEAPILLVEGEDDERIWQQAVRSSQGRIKVYPCAVDSITQLNEYESQVKEIISSVYDSAKAYSLRDRDDDLSELDDDPPVIRMKLECRAAENLLLSDDVLNRLGLDWNTLTGRIEDWLSHNQGHSHYNSMNDFRDSGFDRKNYNLKVIRNDLMGIIESSKPWEVAVGQRIATLSCVDTPSAHSLQAYLGEKLTSNLLQR